MSKSFLFWLMLLLLWLIFAWWICKNYLCGFSAAAPVPVTTGCDVSLNLKDGKTFDLKSESNLRFITSHFDNLSYNNNVSSFLQRTADHLKSNPEKGLTIIGNYAANETNGSIMPNLGMARANTIKSILMSLGAPSRQINLGSDLSSNLCYSKDRRSAEDRSRMSNSNTNGSATTNIDTLNNGVSMAIGMLANADDKLKAIYDRLRANPMTVYFDTNAESLNLDAAQRQDVADITYYLDNVDDSMIEISGHTDNVGNRNYNLNLSKERAEFVKDYFNRNGGLSIAKMDAAGYGPDKPRASNSTPEGKAENRRVEVTFK